MALLYSLLIGSKCMYVRNPLYRLSGSKINNCSIRVLKADNPIEKGNTIER